jgi:hypothetical protein
MHFLDYAVYMYWKQFEMLWLSLASKLGLHPVAIAHVAIAHLSPGTHSLLLVR